MVQVVVGVVLTAVLGGLLVPFVKDRMDRRKQSLESSLELLEVIATGLWTYWALAHRVAYYGQQGERSAQRYDAALRDWDSADAWKNGRDIRIQVSRARRLIPQYQPELDATQRKVVGGFDEKVEALRQSGTPAEWHHFFESLMGEEREAIENVLERLTKELRTQKLIPSTLDGPHWPWARSRSI